MAGSSVIVSFMLSFLALAAALVIGAGTCFAPVARSSEGNFISPGVRSNLAYDSRHSLDAYAPAGEPRPAAVIVHGSSGNKSTHVNQLFPLLDKAGYAWFSVDYDSTEDVRSALDYIRCPGRFNITKHLVLIGEDTGAAIALALARDGHVRWSGHLRRQVGSWATERFSTHE